MLHSMTGTCLRGNVGSASHCCSSDKAHHLLPTKEGHQQPCFLKVPHEPVSQPFRLSGLPGQRRTSERGMVSTAKNHQERIGGARPARPIGWRMPAGWPCLHTEPSQGQKLSGTCQTVCSSSLLELLSDRPTGSIETVSKRYVAV